MDTSILEPKRKPMLRLDAQAVSKPSRSERRSNRFDKFEWTKLELGRDWPSS